MRLEDLTKGATVTGVLPERVITVIDTQWHGSDVVTLTYRDANGVTGDELIFRDREIAEDAHEFSNSTVL